MSTETETPTTPDPLGDWFRRIGASLTLSRDDYEAGIAAIAAHDREVAARALRDAASWARGVWTRTTNLPDLDDHETAYSFDRWLDVLADRIKKGEADD